MNKLPTLSKKTLTKLLNADFRKSILNTYTKDTHKLFPYAKYLVDSTIMSRDKSHAEDKNYGYGFSPLGIVCAVMKDGSVKKRFLEFNTVNYFLRDYKGAFAVEAVKCILILWLNEEKSSIQDFDYMKIDSELAKIEKAYLDAEKEAVAAAEERKQAASKEISAC